MSEIIYTRILARQRIAEWVEEERLRQMGNGFTEFRDMALHKSDWVSVLVRQVGLAAPNDTMTAVEPDRWVRQLVRIQASAQAALEAYLRRHPERLEKVRAVQEKGNEGRTPPAAD